MHRSLAPLAASIALGVLVAGGTAASPSADRAPVRRPHPAPSHFTHGRVDNVWFPLKPGTRWFSRGTEDGRRVSDVMIATHHTKVVDGVTCRVVLDRGFERGRLTERTHDWYAQTRHGTVWYFGEATTTFGRHGQVLSHEGSWRSGVGGAQAGIFMPRHPQVGDAFFQEHDPGTAMDTFRVLDRDASTTAPLLWARHALLTREHSALEPAVVEHKYYVRGIGDVHDVTVRGGDEDVRLVSLRHVRKP
jgi:hypothetical protein